MGLKRGRPTIFDKPMTSAEKQARYNAKKKAEKHDLTLDDIANKHSKNIKQRIGRSLKRKNINPSCAEIKIEFDSKNLASIAILGTRELHAVFYATFCKDSGHNDYASPEFYNSRDEAMSDYNKLLDGDLTEHWLSIEFYKTMAYNFIQKYPSGKFDHYPKTLGFLLALDEVRRDGFRDLEPSDSNVTDKYRTTKRNSRRAILRLVGNIEIKFKLEKYEAHAIAEDILKKCLRSLTNKNLKTSGYRCTRVLALKDLIKTLDKYCFVLNNLNACSDSWLTETVNEVIKNNIQNKSNTKETALRQSTSFQPIPLDVLKRMLNYAWQVNHDLYYLILLQLSIALRIIEFCRKDYSLKDLILPNNLLDYNEIIEKTDNGEKERTYSNPRLSILSRVIINHHTPSNEPKNFFNLSYQRSVRNIIPEMKSFPERSLRTTAGHMLGKCKSIEGGIGKVPEYVIMERMGHVDRSQEVKRYARKDMDSSLDPRSYFNLNGDEIKINNKVITNNSILWDTWLLMDYLEKQEQLYSVNDSDTEEEAAEKEKKFKKVLKSILKEGEIHDRSYCKKEIKTTAKSFNID